MIAHLPPPHRNDCVTDSAARRSVPTARAGRLLLWFAAAALAACCGSLPLSGAPAPGAPGPAAPAPPAYPATYANPLLRDVADPFVLKHRGEYYLYRTSVDGALDVFTSRDLVRWQPGAAVWRPGPEQSPRARHLWAPEVTYDNGRFYLYFNASGEDDQHRLWRAVAASPLGPFRLLPDDPLTGTWRIDAHLFRDWDGEAYLYCCSRLSDGSARLEAQPLAGAAAAVPDAWQPLLGPQRPWEGIWVEAPEMLRDASGYYLLYSAPGARLPQYQVGYAVAPGPLGPWARQGVLIPATNQVAGPGHPCVTLAPDNVTPYLVYHRKRLAEPGWDRDLMLDRLAMGGGRMSTRAPTLTSQPAPPRPAFEDHFDGEASLRSWALVEGEWQVAGAARELRQTAAGGPAAARLADVPFGNAVVEVNLRRTAGDGGVGLALAGSRGRFPVLLFAGGARNVRIETASGPQLPEGLDPAADHQLLLTRRGEFIEVRVDGRPVGQSSMPKGPVTLELVTDGAAAAFSGVAITGYASPRPLPPRPTAAAGALPNGWQRVVVGGEKRIEQRLLGPDPQLFPVEMGLPERGSFSARVRGWALGSSAAFPKYGLRLRGARGGMVEAYVDPATGVLATHGRVGGEELPWQNSPLPLRFDYTAWHTFKVAWDGDRWEFSVDGGSGQKRAAALAHPLKASLVTEDARAVFTAVTVAAKP